MASERGQGIWANAGFRWLWAAATVSVVGDYFRLFAVPFLVFSLTGSALNTGATLAVETLPYLLVSPFAGVLTDRLPRRTVMIASRLAQLVLVGSLPVAYYAGALSLVQVLGVVFAMGCVEVVFGAASLSALAGLVAPGQLVAANSAVQLSFSVAALAGPPLAGVVTGLAGSPAAALVGDAGAQLLAAWALARIGQPMRADRPGGEAVSVLADIREGLVYLWRDRLLRTSALLLFSFNVMLGGTLGQLVVFGRVVLGLHSIPLSLLFAAEGAGAVIGAVLAAPAGRRWTVGRIIVIALPVTALSVLGLSVSPDLPAACAALAVVGVAETIMFVNLLALRQRIVPGHMQGRVNATGRALAVAGTPVGALLAGVLVAPLGGVRQALTVLGGLALANACAAMFSPLVGGRGPGTPQVRPEAGPGSGSLQSSRDVQDTA